MRKVEFTCDRCGEPASEWGRVYEHDLLDGMRAGAHNLREMDLCPRCAAELREWAEVTDDGDKAVES